MPQLLTQSIDSLTRAFESGDLDPVAVVEATLRQIDAVDPLINAIAWVDPEEALDAARASARRWRAGRPLSRLDGVPATIKDAIDLAGTPNPWGSAAYAERPASPVTAPPAARLLEAGAVIVAKTASPDLLMAITGISSLYGIVRNPWDTTASPGGSSAGAGAALAAGIGYGAVGTDLAGSVRIPAARCGVVGLKPTQGRVPHLPPSTVRSPGAMARTCADAALIHQCIAGPDERDTSSLASVQASYAGPAPIGPGWRIGVMPHMGSGTAADGDTLDVLDDAASAVARSGAHVDLLPPPFAVDPLPALERTLQIRARAEWESLTPQQRTRLLPEIAQWSEGGRKYSATDFYRSLAEIDLARQTLRAALADYDYVLTPVVPDTRLEAESRVDPVSPFANVGYTAWFNQSGQPAASVPFGARGGLPVGIQVIGRRFDDDRVLSVAAWLEANRPENPTWPLSPRAAHGLHEARSN